MYVLVCQCKLQGYVRPEWTAYASNGFQLFSFAARQSSKLQFCRLDARRQCVFRLPRVLRTDTSEQITSTFGTCAASARLCALVLGITAQCLHEFHFEAACVEQSTLPSLPNQLQATLCCRNRARRLPGMMLYKHLHWYGPYSLSTVVIMMDVVCGVW